MKLSSIKSPFFIFLFIFGIFLSCSKDDVLSNVVQTTLTVYDFSKTLDGNPPADFVIGTLLASTNQGTLTFSLTAQSPEGALSLDETTGVLKVADPSLFDHSLHPTISGTARVVNGDISENINIILTLKDVIEEKVFEGFTHLKSQAEVDAFGSNNYTTISGTLNIGKVLENEISDIHSLLPLSSLKYIGENLIVGLNPLLQNLEGLENVTYLKSIIYIEKNENLTSIQSLGKARGIYNNVFINQNEKLPNLDGLENLDVVATINILENPSLQNIDGLSGITRASEITIRENPLLDNINGFQNLEKVDGSITLNNNPLLRNIDAFSGVKRILHLTISENNSLLDMDGLQNLELLPNSLYIRDNPVLQSISVFMGLEDAGVIEITKNPNLTNLEGLNNLITVGNLRILDNEAIENLDQLNNLNPLMNYM